MKCRIIPKIFNLFVSYYVSNKMLRFTVNFLKFLNLFLKTFFISFLIRMFFSGPTLEPVLGPTCNPFRADFLLPKTDDAARLRGNAGAHLHAQRHRPATTQEDSLCPQPAHEGQDLLLSLCHVNLVRILHVSPEAFIGGPLALVQNGDMITVDVPARRLHLEVSDEVLAQRRAQWQAPAPRYERGYGWMFSRHILQAEQGCDFDFLETAFGGPVDEPAIF